MDATLRGLVGTAASSPYIVQLPSTAPTVTPS